MPALNQEILNFLIPVNTHQWAEPKNVISDRISDDVYSKIIIL